MRPLALFAFVAILAGGVACTSGKAAVAPNRYFVDGARALSAGDQLATKGCTKGAVESYFRAVELFTLADDPEGLAASLTNIGNLYLGDGKSADALIYYREALSLHTRKGNLEGQVRVLTNMAAAHMGQKATDRAEEALAQAEGLIAQGGLSWPETRITRANLRLFTGNADGALALLREVENGLTAPDARLAASLHFSLGRTLSSLKRHDEALPEFAKALERDRIRGALPLMVGDLREMGTTLTALHRTDEAIWHLERAMGIATLLDATVESKALSAMIAGLSGETKGAPLSVTGYFVERWARGESFASPCH